MAEAEELIVGQDVIIEPHGRRSSPTSTPTGCGRSSLATVPTGSSSGSDWPMADPEAEIAAIRPLGLTAEAEAAILGGTLAGVFGLR